MVWISSWGVPARISSNTCSSVIWKAKWKRGPLARIRRCFRYTGDFTENRADTARNTRHDGSGGNRYETGHQSIFEILATVVSPNLELPYSISDLSFHSVPPFLQGIPSGEYSQSRKTLSALRRIPQHAVLTLLTLFAPGVGGLAIVPYDGTRKRPRWTAAKRRAASQRAKGVWAKRRKQTAK